MKKKTYWLPTRPYSIADAINRMKVAIGSYDDAVAARNAEYNGHAVRLVPPNDFKRRWTAVYHWAGVRAIASGTIQECLVAAKRYYDRGVRGASVTVTVDKKEDAAVCEKLGFVLKTKESEEAHYADWQDERYDELGDAQLLENYSGLPALKLLAESETIDQYRQKVEAMREQRRQQREGLLL